MDDLKDSSSEIAVQLQRPAPKADGLVRIAVQKSRSSCNTNKPPFMYPSRIAIQKSRSSSNPRRLYSHRCFTIAVQESRSSCRRNRKPKRMAVSRHK